MSNAKNIAAAKEVFAKNSSLKELWFTNDGQAFSKEDPAKVHQRELTGKSDGLQLVKNAKFEEEAQDNVVVADAVEEKTAKKKSK